MLDNSLDILISSNLNSYSLDSTGSGVLPKWFSEDGKHFYKAGFFEYGYYNYFNVVYECIAYAIAKKLGINSIDYKLRYMTTEFYEDKILVCESRNYNSYLDSKVLFKAVDLFECFKLNLKSDNLYKDLINICPSLQQSIDKMIIFDFIINNEDRHLNNFLFYKDNSDDKVKLFDLFDNERSLLINLPERLYTRFLDGNMHNKQLDSSKPFRSHHFKQIKLVSSLYDLDIDFSIEEILEDYKELLTEERIRVITKLVEDRLQYLRDTFSSNCDKPMSLF